MNFHGHSDYGYVYRTRKPPKADPLAVFVTTAIKITKQHKRQS